LKHTLGFHLIVVGAAILFPHVISAPALWAANQNPCYAEAEKFCKNIPPGAASLLDCLEKHEGELSRACKDYEERLYGPKEERRERARQYAAIRRTCKDDTVKFCRNVDAVPGGLLTCLTDNQARVSPACSQSLKALQEE